LSHHLLCTSFAFRLYVLTKENLSKMGVGITLVCVNGINLLVIIVMLHEFSHTNTESILQYTDGRIPMEVVNLTIGIIDGLTTRPSAQATFLYVSSTSPIVFTCCIIMQQRIISFLNDNKVWPLTELNKSKVYSKALRSQLIISFIASLGSSLLLLSVFEIRRSPFLDFLQPAINCSVLIVSPLVNLTYVKPYRE
ncbi:hypothetical protein PENTCL1PPCAC_15315, partial [Pristionchus entomophagus]